MEKKRVHMSVFLVSFSPCTYALRYGLVNTELVSQACCGSWWERERCGCHQRRRKLGSEGVSHVSNRKRPTCDRGRGAEDCDIATVANGNFSAAALALLNGKGFALRKSRRGGIRQWLCGRRVEGCLFARDGSHSATCFRRVADSILTGGKVIVSEARSARAG